MTTDYSLSERIKEVRFFKRNGITKLFLNKTSGKPIELIVPPTTEDVDAFVQSVVAGTNITVDSTDPANPVVSSSGGGGGSSDSMPIANATGEVVGTVQTPDPISASGSMGWVQFPADQGVLAWGLVGDAFPRVIISADPTNAGILFGDGVHDAWNGQGSAIQLRPSLWSGSGHDGEPALRLFLTEISNDLVFNGFGVGVVIQDLSEEHRYRIVSNNGVLSTVLVS